MIAVIGGSDNIASIALHQFLGFRVAGQLKSVGFKHNQWLDTIYLQLPARPRRHNRPHPNLILTQHPHPT